MTEKERIEIELSKSGLYADRLTKSKGIWTFKKSYFYRLGQSAKAIAEKIERALPKAKMISSNDRWNRWPKQSWFVIKFEMGEKK